MHMEELMINEAGRTPDDTTGLVGSGGTDGGLDFDFDFDGDGAGADGSETGVGVVPVGVGVILRKTRTILRF
eukprot:CAMPEP_0203650652 /NCGR_PEP_ID=MMETSP0088-20131115/25221_1 /ASSEMBLY_ACC=CAM_ASM_001087 /TAXON_ID=426623 /ORGANISM="Chaetoceros affinis, Strain CCMP159" /LENGTH=71 /DNA_ID=CAMNT_0050509505 /DNA_START=128 /DNA_END=340 /DNA_ORIENTATION=+